MEAILDYLETKLPATGEFFETFLSVYKTVLKERKREINDQLLNWFGWVIRQKLL